MMTRILVTVVLGLIMGLIGCQVGHDSSGLKDEAFNPLFVVTGGFNTCGRGGDPSTHGLAIKLKELQARYADRLEGRIPDAIVTCFNGFTSNWIYYYSTVNKNVRYTRWNDHRALIEEINAYGDRPVIIVGHSYGGWLAMKVASYLDSGRDSLVTIDPISPNHCAQGGVIGGAVSSWFGGNGTDGCTTFPKDISRNVTRRLMNRYKWYHFFQDQYEPIHSNVVDNTGPAGFNSLVTDQSKGLDVHFPAGGGSNGGVHSSINKHDLIWNRIEVLAGIRDAAVAFNEKHDPAVLSLTDASYGLPNQAVKLRVEKIMEPVVGAVAPEDMTTPAEQIYSETGVWSDELDPIVESVLNGAGAYSEPQ